MRAAAHQDLSRLDDMEQAFIRTSQRLMESNPIFFSKISEDVEYMGRFRISGRDIVVKIKLDLGWLCHVLCFQYRLMGYTIGHQQPVRLEGNHSPCRSTQYSFNQGSCHFLPSPFYQTAFLCFFPGSRGIQPVVPFLMLSVIDFLSLPPVLCSRQTVPEHPVHSWHREPAQFPGTSEPGWNTALLLGEKPDNRR